MELAAKAHRTVAFGGWSVISRITYGDFEAHFVQFSILTAPFIEKWASSYYKIFQKQTSSTLICEKKKTLEQNPDSAAHHFIIFAYGN